MGDVEGEVDVDEEEYDTEESEEEEEDVSEEDGGESDDEGIDDLKRIYFKSVPEGDEGGKTTYLRKCEELKIVPIRSFYDGAAGSCLDGVSGLGSTYVDLRHHSMGEKGATAIAHALAMNFEIKSIDLTDNFIEAPGGEQLALAVLQPTNKTLTSINLSDNKLGRAGIEAFSEQLAQNDSLLELFLRNNKIDDEGAEEVAKALSANTTCTRVDLSHNAIGEKGGIYLGGMLITNSDLRMFDLSWNSVHGKGAKALSEGLAANRSVTSCNLGWNSLGQEKVQHITAPGGTGDRLKENYFGEAFSNTLKTNSTLRFINLAHNNITADCAQTIADGIKANKGLLSIVLDNNPLMGPEGGLHVIRALKEVNRLKETYLGLNNIGADVQTHWASKAGKVALPNYPSRFHPLPKQKAPVDAIQTQVYFDPKHPEGDYRLDLNNTWDQYIAETIYSFFGDPSVKSLVNFKSCSLKVDGPDGSTSTDRTLEQGMPTMMTPEQWKHKPIITQTPDYPMLKDLDVDPQYNPLTAPASNAFPPGQGILSITLKSTKKKVRHEEKVVLDLSNKSHRADFATYRDRVLRVPGQFWKDAKMDGVPFNLPDDGSYDPDESSEKKQTLSFIFVSLFEEYLGGDKRVLNLSPHIELNLGGEGKTNYKDRYQALRLHKRVMAKDSKESFSEVTLNDRPYEIPKSGEWHLPLSGVLKMVYNYEPGGSAIVSHMKEEISKVELDSLSEDMKKLLPVEGPEGHPGTPDNEQLELLNVAATKYTFTTEYLQILILSHRRDEEVPAADCHIQQKCKIVKLLYPYITDVDNLKQLYLMKAFHGDNANWLTHAFVEVTSRFAPKQDVPPFLAEYRTRMPLGFPEDQ